MDKRDRHRRHTRRCVALTVVVGTLLFFGFVWDGLVTSVATHRLRAVTGRSDATVARIHGAFPFHFRVPLIDVPGWGTVNGLDVTYDGTYNPFHWTTQTGPVAHARVDAITVDAVGFTGPMTVPLDDVRLVRHDDGSWHVTCTSRVYDHVVVAAFHVDPITGPVAANVTVDATVAVRWWASQRMVATYGPHTVVDVQWTHHRSDHQGGPWTDVTSTWADTVQVVVDAVRVRPGPSGSVARVAVGTFHAPPHTVLRDIVVDTSTTGNTSVAFVDAVTTTRSAFTVQPHGVDGTVWRRPLHVTWPGPDPVHAWTATWSPPWTTPFGGVATVTTDGTAVHVGWTDPRTPPLVWGPGWAVRFGPVRLHAGADALHLTIDGGRFHRFECVTLHGTLRYTDPTRVVLDHVSVGTADGERMHGTGEYLLPQRKLKFSFDVEILT